MKLTIGMAQFDDFDGVYFTIQALRMYNLTRMPDVELLVVNNSPGAPSTPHISTLVQDRAAPGTAAVKYVELGDDVGTSAARNRVFAEASGDYVLCLDSHVLLWPGALDALLGYYDQNPDTSDIISGPLVHDHLTHMSTHFNDEWRAEMWGTWGTAWHCSCGVEGVHFAVMNHDERARYVALMMGAIPMTSCVYCGKELPDVPYAGHEFQLQQEGYNLLANQTGPFEIPGQGLGLFSCRRDAWLGFNEHATNFGGEELYIHEKFRQAGHKALCIPQLMWVHRFSRPNGVKYPLTPFAKIRNYILEFNELGRPLDEIHQHFVVEAKRMTQSDWDILVADPIEAAHFRKDPNSCSSCGSSKKRQMMEDATGLTDIYDKARKVKRDLDKHMPTLREYANKVERVTEISNRIESAIAFAASDAKVLTLHNTEAARGLDVLTGFVRVEKPDVKITTSHEASSAIDVIDDCDLLFIDSTHTYKALSEELAKYHKSVKRFIVMHDTQVHGAVGEDGGPGLLKAITEFLKAHPEWSTVYHTNDQYGLTILGCQRQDKPKMPSLVQMASNFTAAMAKHVATGAGHVSHEVLEERLTRCSWCEQRVDGRCAQCGCPLASKAPQATAKCDLGRWKN